MLLGQKILLYHILTYNVIKVSWYDFVCLLMLLEITRESPQSPGVRVLWGGCLNVPVEDDKTCES